MLPLATLTAVHSTDSKTGTSDTRRGSLAVHVVAVVRRLECPGFDPWPGTSLRALGPTQPTVQRELDVIFLAIMRPERNADHLVPSNATVKNEWICTSTPLYAFMTCRDKCDFQ